MFFQLLVTSILTLIQFVYGAFCCHRFVCTSLLLVIALCCLIIIIFYTVYLKCITIIIVCSICL